MARLSLWALTLLCLALRQRIISYAAQSPEKGMDHGVSIFILWRVEEGPRGKGGRGEVQLEQTVQSVRDLNCRLKPFAASPILPSLKIIDRSA